MKRLKEIDPTTLTLILFATGGALALLSLITTKYLIFPAALILLVAFIYTLYILHTIKKELLEGMSEDIEEMRKRQLY
jgi:ABC-type Na+ efflux pump permease subunit